MAKPKPEPELRTRLREERETIIRWDEADPTPKLYTSSPAMAQKWRKRGYPVHVFGTANGEPHSWTASVPKGSVTFRRLIAGAVAKRKLSSTAFQRVNPSQDETTPREAGQTTPS